jgi:hypothetical protein
MNGQEKYNSWGFGFSQMTNPRKKAYAGRTPEQERDMKRRRNRARSAAMAQLAREYHDRLTEIYQYEMRRRGVPERKKKPQPFNLQRVEGIEGQYRGNLGKWQVVVTRVLWAPETGLPKPKKVIVWELEFWRPGLNPIIRYSRTYSEARTFCRDVSLGKTEPWKKDDDNEALLDSEPVEAVAS